MAGKGQTPHGGECDQGKTGPVNGTGAGLGLGVGSEE